jgi:hypothetical protein
MITKAIESKPSRKSFIDNSHLLINPEKTKKESKLTTTKGTEIIIKTQCKTAKSATKHPKLEDYLSVNSQKL